MSSVMLNPDLLATYALDVSNWQILGVMADDMDEQGDPVAADALRWLFEKRRVPILLDTHQDRGWGGYLKDSVAFKPYHLPMLMWQSMSARMKGNAEECLVRVIDAWKEWPENRAEWWSWNPYEIEQEIARARLQ